MPRSEAKQSAMSIPPKAIAGGVVCAVLLVVLVWVWWPSEGTTTPEMTEAQRAVEQLNKDPNANPPVPEVTATGDGPRRRAMPAK